MRSTVHIGKLNKRIDIPFVKTQLNRLSAEELLMVATIYKRRGLKTTLIKHLTAYYSDKNTNVSGV